MLFTISQEWERKATEAKERYVKQVAAFEANGGSSDAPSSGKKRGKAPKKAAPKKSKKAGSDDESADESD